ncbi:MAG: site-specific DNA-methyltransferase [Rhizobiales bacterium]|nr:site-specific DNA-methyltransferase [Hyphomicrobiales bacterium]
MEKLDGKSMDIIEQNIEQLKELFPSVFSEGKVQFNKLEELLGNYVVDDEDHYNFTWHGKRKAGRLAQTPSTGTLRPCKDESVDWDNTENLFIEGDNLEVLKLLQKSYHRQVKMIYIDPPYNTGNDFVYEDDFKDGVKNYLEMTGQLDSDGKKMGTNSSSAGRYHTNWLNMMYPRLKLARNLLRQDGAVFISIDDNESHRLISICSEIFGEENFVAQLAVQLNPRGRNLDKFIAKTHESVLVFVKDYMNENSIFGVEKMGRMVDEYNKKDDIGQYRLTGLRNRNQAFNPSTRPKLYYPMYVNKNTGQVSIEESPVYTDEVWPDTPDGTKTCWTWGKEKAVNENHLLTADKTGDEWRIYRKDYLLDENGKMATTLVKSIWLDKEINNDYGRKTIKDLFGSSVMSFPKAVDLIKKLVQIGTNNNDIIIDFFAGSATTAHAVYKINTEDRKKRRCISVQLPEVTDDKSEAYKAGYKTISDIAKERIRRAGKKIKEENPLFSGDLGFKVFKLDTSNIKRWEADFDTLESDLLGAVDYLVEGRSDEDVLYELCLKLGLDLTIQIEEKTIAGKKVSVLGRGYLVVCLDNDITMDLVSGIGALKEEIAPEDGMRVVFKDDGFADDVVKTNALQTLKRFGINDIKSL